MTLRLSILCALLLAGCSTQQPVTAPMPQITAQMVAAPASLQLRIGRAGTNVVFSVNQQTNFTVYAAPRLDLPRPWTLLATQTGGLCHVPAAALASFTNPPVWFQKLAWNANPDPAVTGYNVYWGGVSGQYTNHQDAGPGTNATISGLSPGTYYYAATSYATNGIYVLDLPVEMEGLLSTEVIGQPEIYYPPLTVFFYATTP
jgi:hypothetical protein